MAAYEFQDVYQGACRYTGRNGWWGRDENGRWVRINPTDQRGPADVSVTSPPELPTESDEHSGADFGDKLGRLEVEQFADRVLKLAIDRGTWDPFSALNLGAQGLVWCEYLEGMGYLLRSDAERFQVTSGFVRVACENLARVRPGDHHWVDREQT